MPRRPSNVVNPTAPHFLTAPTVDLLPVTGVQYRVRDAGAGALTGFAVQVSPGGVKTYTLDYRVRGDRRTLRMTFGRFPLVPPNVARREALAAKSLALTGRDPAAERVKENTQLRELRDSAKRISREQRDAVRAASLHTLERLARDYVRDRRHQLKAGTVALYESAIATALTGDLGATPLQQLTQSDVRELLRTVAEKQLPAGVTREPRPSRTIEGKVLRPRATGGEGAARTLRRLLKSVWSYAADERELVTGRCPVPSAKSAGLVEREKERFLSPEECARLLRTIELAATVGIPPAPEFRRTPATGATAKHRPSVGVETPFSASPVAIAALRFALLTGWRRTEILSLEWSMIRRDLGVIILPDTKTDESVRAISPEALAILEAVPRLVASRWCFPSPKSPRTHLRTITRLWAAVRHAADLRGARLHDLRHTAASLAINAGASLVEVQAMLGHKSARATQRYAKLIPSTGLRAAEKLSAALDAAAKAPVPTVTPITSARRRRV